MNPSVRVVIPGNEADRIRRWGRRLHPEEACGLLLGHWRDDEGGRYCEAGVVRAVRARNRHAQPRIRYDLHPRDFLRIERRAKAGALDVVGIWHSHPDGGTQASPTDVEEAWRGWIYLIAGMAAEGADDLKAWLKVASGEMESVGLVIEPGRP